MSEATKSPGGAATGTGEATKGFWSVIAACTMWGMFSLYFHMLADVPPLEVLAHRTIWSLAFFAVIVLAQRRGAELRALLCSRQIWLVAAAALAISSNWFVYIWSVAHGHVVEASLGYFIFPLVAVVMGLIVFHERIGRWQALAVAIAAAGVVYLAWGLGAAPWISLILAVTMCLYGMFKKGLPFAPDVTVMTEVLLLSPFALAYLAAAHFGWGMPPGSGLFGHDLRHTLLLIVSGVLTGVPLMMFSYGAQRVRLGTLGLSFYVNPTLQFLIAVLVLGEPLTPVHMVAFPLIWLALAIYSAASLRAAPAPEPHA